MSDAAGSIRIIFGDVVDAPRKGDCWDKAVAESFFATLKRELEGIDVMESRAAATISIGEYIDGFYNLERRHSAINDTSPVEFELIHSVKRAA